MSNEIIKKLETKVQNYQKAIETQKDQIDYQHEQYYKLMKQCKEKEESIQHTETKSKVDKGKVPKYPNSKRDDKT